MIKKIRLVLFTFFAFLAAFNSFPVFAEDTTTGEARELLEQARKFGNVGNIKGALEEFKKATLVKPDYAEAHRGVGMAYVMLKHNDEAIAPLKEAIRLKPDYANAHYLLGLAYEFLQRYNESMVSYEQAVRFNSSNANAHSNLGSVYLRLNRFEEAMTSYKQAIRLRPNDSEAHRGLGEVFVKLKRYEEAVSPYKTSIQLNPDDANTNHNLGFAYTNLKQYDEAIIHFKEAVRLKPDFVEAHFSIGYAFDILQHYDESIAPYKEVVRLQPDHAQAHFYLGNAYYRKRNGALAIKHMKKAKALYRAKGDMESVSMAGKNLRIFFNEYGDNPKPSIELNRQIERAKIKPKSDLKEKIRLAKKRQTEINDQFKTLQEMEGLDDSLISPGEKLEAVKKFIRDYPDRNQKLEEAQKMLERIKERLNKNFRV